MKILQICNKSPYPPHDGGSIAMNNITCGLLNAGHQVKILSVNTPKYFVKPDELQDDYRKATNYESVFIDTRIKLFKAFFNLFSSKSYNIERFISADFNNKLKQILSASIFDIIQLESVYVSPYIPTIRKYSDAKIVLRTHNIENLIWSRLANNCRNPLKKIYLKHLSHKLKHYENRTFHYVDGIAAITQLDAECIINSGCNKPVISFPVGINCSAIKDINSEREFPGFFHLGSMDWLPNQEGIKWFLDKVWDKIIAEYPNALLYLAGRNMPKWLLETNKIGVVIIGKVENAYNFMQSKSVMIVPIMSGSGMRVKIIEGMACGNTVISTSIGAEGICYTKDNNILISDTPEQFAAQMKKCIQYPSLCRDIGIQAKNLINEHYNNNVIINNLLQFYNRLLQPL